MRRTVGVAATTCALLAPAWPAAAAEAPVELLVDASAWSWRQSVPGIEPSNVPAGDLAKLPEPAVWQKVREATERALQGARVRRNHPFKGVIGPELTNDERLDLVEYLKSL